MIINLISQYALIVILMKSSSAIMVLALIAIIATIPYISAQSTPGLQSGNRTYVSMQEPYNATIYSNSTVDLGRVGPGQTFYITISSETQNQTGAVFNLGWNQLVATGTPYGWISENSSLNTKTLSVRIKPSPNATNGTYSFYLTAINSGNYSKLGAVKFKVSINVTTNVFSLSVNPKIITTGPGEPGDVYVNITNTGVSDVPFEISALGLPEWNLTQTVIAPHNTTREFAYPIYVYEPGSYNVRIHVYSEASDLIYKDSNITLIAKPGLLNDFSAIGKGTLIFPIIYEPEYAVLYLISRIHL